MNRSHIIDSHTHLQDYETNTDIGKIIDQSLQEDIAYFICNGTEPDDWETVKQMSESYSQIIPCYGLHPWFTDKALPGWIDKLENYIIDSKAGIGEIGLDRLRKPFDIEKQESAFRSQLELACKYRRSVMMHCVDSWGWMIEILRNMPSLPDKMLIHSFAGSVDSMKILHDMGAYFSFSGTVLYDNHKKARNAFISTPIDRILIESDAPSMTPPISFRKYSVQFSDGYIGNHPGNLPDIIIGLANLLNVSTQSMKDIAWDNSIRFFENMLCDK